MDTVTKTETGGQTETVTKTETGGQTETITKTETGRQTVTITKTETGGQTDRDSDKTRQADRDSDKNRDRHTETVTKPETGGQTGWVTSGPCVQHEPRSVWLKENQDGLTVMKLAAQCTQPLLFNFVVSLKGQQPPQPRSHLHFSS